MVVPIVLAALRSVALRKAANATAKIRRLESTGIRIAGSLYDPRREAANVNRYTRKQLNAYISTLDEFTSRSTKFVRGAGGAAISMMDLSAYKNAETLYNLTGDRFRRRNAKLPLPGEDATVEELQTDGPRSFINAADNTMLPRKNRGAESFPGAQQIRQSRRTLERRMGRAYVEFRKRSTIDAMDKAFRKMGANEVAKSFKELPDDAKQYLIFDTGFVDNVFQGYHADGETGGVADNESILMSMINHADGLFGDENGGA